jgi:nicotinate-nucleotide adenylyltransferase
MKRYGVLGGTFNPPHMAHSTLAEKVRLELKLDKIIIIPSAIPPLKNNNEVLEIKHRFEMAKIAFGNNPNYEVSDIEINNSSGKSYTVNTLTKLQKKLIGETVNLYLILGIDSLIDFPKWKNPEKLFELSEVVIINRPGFSKNDIQPEYLKKVKFINTELMDISSTKIREFVRNNKSIKSLVLPEIEKYITQNNLYK